MQQKIKNLDVQVLVKTFTIKAGRVLREKTSHSSSTPGVGKEMAGIIYHPVPDAQSELRPE